MACSEEGSTWGTTGGGETDGEHDMCKTERKRVHKAVTNGHVTHLPFLNEDVDIVQAGSESGTSPQTARCSIAYSTQTRNVSRVRAFASTAPPKAGKSFTSHPLLPFPNTPADIVQELYLRELKSYKPTPVVSQPGALQEISD